MIKTHEVIVYQDLIDTTINNILNLVQNKDSYSASVPAQVKPGYSEVITINRTYHPATGEAAATAGELGTSCKVTFTLGADTRLNTVATNTIKNDFNNFMASRGILAKANLPITTKGAINFFNNVAAFCSVKLILVTSQLTNSEVVFYNQVDADYPTVPVEDNETPITSADITNMLSNLNTTLNKVTKAYNATYSVATSSSCSSSSSSSSSSAYIAYFNLR